MTLRGLEVLRRADLVVYDRLVSPALLDEAPPAALRIYAGKLAGWHSVDQDHINAALFVHHARRGCTVVRLKGGDPFVFEVVPGVSAAAASASVITGATSRISVVDGADPDGADRLDLRPDHQRRGAVHEVGSELADRVDGVQLLVEPLRRLHRHRERRQHKRLFAVASLAFRQLQSGPSRSTEPTGRVPGPVPRAAVAADPDLAWPRTRPSRSGPRAGSRTPLPTLKTRAASGRPVGHEGAGRGPPAAWSPGPHGGCRRGHSRASSAGAAPSARSPCPDRGRSRTISRMLAAHSRTIANRCSPQSGSAMMSKVDEGLQLPGTP
jgi:tetrapyrrole (corrin/porphyrin) methylase-like protein